MNHAHPPKTASAPKSGTPVAQNVPLLCHFSKTAVSSAKAFPKTDYRFWRERLAKRVHGRQYQASEYCELLRAGKLPPVVTAASWMIRLQSGGERRWCSLKSADRDTAARRALRAHQVAQAQGIEAAVRELDDEGVVGAPVLIERGAVTGSAVAALPVVKEMDLERDLIVVPRTVGDLIQRYQFRSTLKPRTLASYVQKFRLLVGDIFSTPSLFDGRSPLAELPPLAKYDYFTGGATQWRNAVDEVPLSELTRERLIAWKSSYLRRRQKALGEKGVAVTDVVTRGIKNSLNSILLNARGLFADPNIEACGIKLPAENPFLGVRREKVRDVRYHSSIDLRALLVAANSGLKPSLPDLYLSFLLALCCGLRRGEIDRLQWKHVNVAERRVRIESTAMGDTKTPESAGDVDLDPTLAAIFAEYAAGAEPESFVVEAKTLAPSGHTGKRVYRARLTFDLLLAWLKQQGVTARSGIHTLRKEFGSQIVKQHDIFSASIALRHASIVMTSRTYAKKPGPISFDLSKVLPADQSTKMPP